jgi:hypothetical protein
MDYATPNIAGPGQPVGDFYIRGMGSYDRWAIAYGYTPEASRAAELARQAAEPGHAYGTDEDNRGPGALDPTVNIYDLGEDPLAWGKERARTIRGTWGDVPTFALEDDASYSGATAVFSSLLFQYARALGTGVKYIGGQYLYRDHVGDPGGRRPWVNVPRERQVEALRFLVEFGFSEDAFALPPEVLQQFGANRWSHWGSDLTIDGRIDYPYHGEVLDLQRAHLERMTELVTDAPSGTPADARSVARMTLEGLRNALDVAVGTPDLDAYTRAHLNESRVRVDRALSAGLELSN